MLRNPPLSHQCLKGMHTLDVLVGLTHTRMHTRTHTLTQFSKELNSQSCIDEEQQHEEQTQIPHLDRRVERTHIHTHRYIQYVIHRNKRHVQSTLRGAEHANREREREGEAGDRNVVSP